MYLSRVLIKPPHLENAWQWHRHLWSLFPDYPNGSHCPFLYRVEVIKITSGVEVLMQSIEKPLLETEKAKVLAYKTFEPTFFKGQILHFLLQVNTIKCIKDRKDIKKAKDTKKIKRSIRVPLIKESEKQDWLKRKFNNIATIDSNLTIITAPPTRFYKSIKGQKGAVSGKIVKTTFNGILQIQSPDDLKQQLIKGIGPAKSFGCGLLSLAVS